MVTRKTTAQSKVGPRIPHPASRIPHLASRISHLASRISHLASCISHPASRIPHLASRISHPASCISHPASRIPHLASRISHLASRISQYAIFLLLIGCSSFDRSTPPTPTTVSTTTVEPIRKAVEPIPGIDDTGAEVATVAPGAELSETYRNTIAGYAFDYPAGWLVDGEGEYVSLQNYRSEDLPPREVNDPDLYKIEFVWIRPKQARTVDEMFDQMRDGVDSTAIQITVNGLAGIRTVVRGFDDDTSDVLLLDLKGRVLLIQSWQAGQLFDRVTATLRPIGGED